MKSNGRFDGWVGGVILLRLLESINNVIVCFTAMGLMDGTVVGHKPSTKRITVTMKLDPPGYKVEEEPMQTDQGLVVAEIMEGNPTVMNLVEILTSYPVSSKIVKYTSF